MHAQPAIVPVPIGNPFFPEKVLNNLDFLPWVSIRDEECTSVYLKFKNTVAVPWDNEGESLIVFYTEQGVRLSLHMTPDYSLSCYQVGPELTDGWRAKRNISLAARSIDLGRWHGNVLVIKYKTDTKELLDVREQDERHIMYRLLG